MSEYINTGIEVEESDVCRIYTCRADYEDVCINIDLHGDTTSLYFTRAELKAMIAAIDARVGEEKCEELSRD